jgi:Holliday junction resolvase RusA-like endonuclease
MELRFDVKIEPAPASRPRISSRGTHYSKRYTKFRKNFKYCLLIGLKDAEIKRTDLPLEGELEVEYIFRCRQPSSPSHPYPRGDVDNYAKAVQDSLESGGLFGNDSQITRMAVEKQYAPKGEDGWIEITIRTRSS